MSSIGSWATSVLALLLVVSSTLLTSTAEASPRVRVMSWNVWGIPYVSDDVEGRMAQIVPAIAEHSPDVVALQEVWEESHGDRLARDFRAGGWPHVRHFRGHGRKGGLLIASRHPFREMEYVRFSMGDLPLVPWHVDWMADKGVARVEIDHPQGRFGFANTHLQAAYIGRNGYVTTRLSQAMELARSLAELGGPLVLAGDINTREGELGFRALQARARVHDTGIGARVDAIMQRGFEVRSRHILFREDRDVNGVAMPLSDHGAVMADLVRTEAPAAFLSWSEVRNEVEAYLARDKSSMRNVGVIVRFASLVVVGAFAVWARKRRRRWWFLYWKRGAALGLVALALLYLGFAYLPRTEKQMADTADQIEADHDLLAARDHLTSPRRSFR